MRQTREEHGRFRKRQRHSASITGKRKVVSVSPGVVVFYLGKNDVHGRPARGSIPVPAGNETHG